VQTTVKTGFWHGRIGRYVPLILCIAVIAFMSSGQASMSNTSRFIRPLLEFLFPNSPEEILQMYHGYIRKLAHVTEYAILALMASRAFVGSARVLLSKFWFLWSLGIVIIVASSDEFNQSFNSNRTGSVWDVLLDCIGGFAAICFVSLYLKFVSKYRES
jgi:VanZ family protein